jgi:hypothetical protein
LVSSPEKFLKGVEQAELVGHPGKLFTNSLDDPYPFFIIIIIIIIEKMQTYTKVKAWNEPLCVHHPASTVFKVLSPLFIYSLPFSKNILKQIPDVVSFYPYIFHMHH